MMASTQEYALAALVRAPLVQRAGGGVLVGRPARAAASGRAGTVTSRCSVLFGASLGPFSRRLFEWMQEEGACTAADRDKDWINLGMQLCERGGADLGVGAAPRPRRPPSCRTKTKAELLTAALGAQAAVRSRSRPRRAGRPGPARGPPATGTTWTTGLGHRSASRAHSAASAPRPPPRPAAAATSASTPPRCWRQQPTAGRPPSAAAVSTAPPTPPARSSPARWHLPLAGLKVLDLMWAVAGPSTTRVLADYGATVVRVESRAPARRGPHVGPSSTTRPVPRTPALFDNMNAGKLGLALDLPEPEAREVVLDLVRWADVVIESFSPRAMAALGPRLRRRCAQVNPEPDHGVELPDGPDRAAGLLRRLRQPGRRASPASTTSPAGPTGARRPLQRLHRLRRRPASRCRRCWPRSTTGDAPARASTSTSPRPRRRCTSWPRRCSTTRSTAAWPTRQGNDDPRFAPHGVYATAAPRTPARSTARWRSTTAMGGGGLARPTPSGGARRPWPPDLADLDAAERRARRRELDEVGRRLDRRPRRRRRREAAPGRPTCPPTACRTRPSASDPQLAHRGALRGGAPTSSTGTTWVEGSRLPPVPHARGRRAGGADVRPGRLAGAGRAPRLRRRPHRRARRRRSAGVSRREVGRRDGASRSAGVLVGAAGRLGDGLAPHDGVVQPGPDGLALVAPRQLAGPGGELLLAEPDGAGGGDAPGLRATAGSRTPGRGARPPRSRPRRRPTTAGSAAGRRGCPAREAT